MGTDVQAKQSLLFTLLQKKFYVMEQAVTLIHRFLQIIKKYLELVFNAYLAYITVITKMHNKAT
jgi:hypothetical protein